MHGTSNIASTAASRAHRLSAKRGNRALRRHAAKTVAALANA
jgi:hypothetical protein